MSSLKTAWSEFFEARNRAIQNKDKGDESYKSEREKLHAKLADPTKEDETWLLNAMMDEERRRSFFWMFEKDPPLNAKLIAPLLEGAIAEINPSFNRYFVDPAVSNFGVRKVYEYLFSVIEHGEPFRQAGAVNALYWAQPPLVWTDPQSPADLMNLTYKTATEESKREYEAITDLHARKQVLLLRVFIETNDLDVQRSIIPALNLDLKSWPKEMRESVEKAINIATNHPDKYIWHRSGVQLGTRSTLMAIPYRGSPLIPRTDEEYEIKKNHSRWQRVVNYIEAQQWILIILEILFWVFILVIILS